MNRHTTSTGQWTSRSCRRSVLLLWTIIINRHVLIHTEFHVSNKCVIIGAPSDVLVLFLILHGRLFKNSKMIQRIRGKSTKHRIPAGCASLDLLCEHTSYSGLGRSPFLYISSCVFFYSVTQRSTIYCLLDRDGVDSYVRLTRNKSCLMFNW